MRIKSSGTFVSVSKPQAFFVYGSTDFEQDENVPEKEFDINFRSFFHSVIG
jgi:hypothetical protein